MKISVARKIGLSTLAVLLLSACGHGGDDSSTGNNTPIKSLSDSYIAVNASTNNTIPFTVGNTAGTVMVAPVIGPDINQNDQLVGFFGLDKQSDDSSLIYSVVLDQDSDYVRPKTLYIDKGIEVVFDYRGGVLEDGSVYNTAATITLPSGQIIERYFNIQFSDSDVAVATITQHQTGGVLSKVINLVLPKKVRRILNSASDIMPMIRSATEMITKAVKDVVNVKDLLSDLMKTNAADIALKQAVDSDNLIDQTSYYGLFFAKDFTSRMESFGECSITRTPVGCLGAIETLSGDISNLYELGKLGIEEIKNRQHNAEMEKWAALQDQMIKNRVRRIPKSSSRPASTYEECKISYSDAACALIFDVDLSIKPNTTGFTKLDITGKILSDSVSKWACARDNKTGMVWEVIDEGAVLYGSIADYLSSYKKQKLCGYSDWRIPTMREYEGNESMDFEAVPGLRAGQYHLVPSPPAYGATTEVNEDGSNVIWDQRYCSIKLVKPSISNPDQRPYCPDRYEIFYFTLVRG